MVQMYLLNIGVKEMIYVPCFFKQNAPMALLENSVNTTIRKYVTSIEKTVAIPSMAVVKAMHACSITQSYALTP